MVKKSKVYKSQRQLLCTFPFRLLLLEVRSAFIMSNYFLFLESCTVCIFYIYLWHKSYNRLLAPQPTFIWSTEDSFVDTIQHLPVGYGNLSFGLVFCFFNLLLCVPVMGLCIYVYMWRLEGHVKCLRQLLSTLCFETGFLTETGVHQVR